MYAKSLQNSQAAILGFDHQCSKESLSKVCWSFYLESVAPLHKTPKFHLISWCGNLAETHIFHRVWGDSQNFVLIYNPGQNNLHCVKCGNFWCGYAQFQRQSPKKWSFPLRVSSVNVTKSAVSCEFGHIYWRNP